MLLQVFKFSESATAMRALMAWLGVDVVNFHEEAVSRRFNLNSYFTLKQTGHLRWEQVGVSKILAAVCASRIIPVFAAAVRAQSIALDQVAAFAH